MKEHSLITFDETPTNKELKDFETKAIEVGIDFAIDIIPILDKDNNAVGRNIIFKW